MQKQKSTCKTEWSQETELPTCYVTGGKSFTVLRWKMRLSWCLQQQFKTTSGLNSGEVFLSYVMNRDVHVV